MLQKIKFTVLLISVFSLAAVFFVSSMTAQNQKPTAEQEYKNIQVLKNLPAEDLLKVMDLFSASLGVKCNFCHVAEYEKDDKKEKQTARKMIAMTFEINKNNFNGRAEVVCATCHRKEEHPASFPALGVNLFEKGEGATETTRPKNPTIDEVLEKYYTALGGKPALDKITSRTMHVTRTTDEGVKIQEEIYQKPQGKMLIVSHDSQNPYTLIFNGTQFPNDDVFTKDEIEQMRRDAELFQPTHIKEVYTQMSVVGVDKINGKVAYVVRAQTASNKRERLYFDKTTGLLVRRFASVSTMLGQFPMQIDYLDYKLVGGVKVPFTIQWSTPGRVWTRKVLDVKNNVVIDDSKFNSAK